MCLTAEIIYSNVLMHRESSGSLLAEDAHFLQWSCVLDNQNRICLLAIPCGIHPSPMPELVQEQGCDKVNHVGDGTFIGCSCSGAGESKAGEEV